MVQQKAPKKGLTQCLLQSSQPAYSPSNHAYSRTIWLAYHRLKTEATQVLTSGIFVLNFCVRRLGSRTRNQTYWESSDDCQNRLLCFGSMHAIFSTQPITGILLPCLSTDSRCDSLLFETEEATSLSCILLSSSRRWWRYSLDYFQRQLQTAYSVFEK